AEIFDPVTETWTLTGSMGHARTDGHTATLLRDGRVLVAGGSTQSGIHPSADIYNPATGQFLFNGAMVMPRQFHAATLLGDGTVLLASGTTVNGLSTPTAELYDPVANVFRRTLTDMLRGHADYTATSLPDGRVVLVGGQPFCQSGAENRVERYEPLTQQFSQLGFLTLPRVGHVAAQLPNGSILIVGGSQANSSCLFTGLLDTAEIFDPVTGSSRLLASRLCSKKFRPTISPLPDGRFLIAGGFNRDNSHDASGCADIYDPATETFSPTGRMVFPRGDHFAVPLANGDILMGGGNDEAGDTTTATAEIYENVTPEDGAFQSPPGDFTVLRRNLDGSFTRTFKDQTKIQYNAAGLQTAVVDRNNNATAYAYDAAGRLTSMTDPAGQVWTLAYDGNGRLQSVTDPATRITRFAHDSEGNLVQITKADGNTIGYAYEPHHQLTRHTDERGKVATHAYDPFGRLTSVAYPTGEIRRFLPTQVQGVVVPSSGLGTPANPAPIVRSQDVVARMEDANGHATLLTLDAFGTPIRQEDPLGRATSTTRDANNLPTRVVRPNGSVVTMSYDGFGNLLSSTEQDDPNGPATTTYTYDP
ncbi:MAG: kelch repeat-containing protein, partial [Actinomycetota bacterium]